MTYHAIWCADGEKSVCKSFCTLEDLLEWARSYLVGSGSIFLFEGERLPTTGGEWPFLVYDNTHFALFHFPEPGKPDQQGRIEGKQAFESDYDRLTAPVKD